MTEASAELCAFLGIADGEVVVGDDFAILQSNAEMVPMENMEAFFFKKYTKIINIFVFTNGDIGKEPSPNSKNDPKNTLPPRGMFDEGTFAGIDVRKHPRCKGAKVQPFCT